MSHTTSHRAMASTRGVKGSRDREGDGVPPCGSGKGGAQCAGESENTRCVEDPGLGFLLPAAAGNAAVPSKIRNES